MTALHSEPGAVFLAAALSGGGDSFQMAAGMNMMAECVHLCTLCFLFCALSGPCQVATVCGQLRTRLPQFPEVYRCPFHQRSHNSNR